MSWKRLVAEFGDDLISVIRKSLPDIDAPAAERVAQRLAKSNAKPPAKAAAKATPKAEGKSLSVKRGTPKGKSLSVKRDVPALPAPKKTRPDYAVKDKGGQWFPDKVIGGTQMESPEAAAREFWRRRYAVPDDQLGGQTEADVRGALQGWWERAAPKYLKNEFGTADDPLRALIAEGRGHTGSGVADVDVSDWDWNVGRQIVKIPVGDVTMPMSGPGVYPGAGSNRAAYLRTGMPWLSGLPSTDNIHIVDATSLNQLEFPHIIDEMTNALDPSSHLPPDLKLNVGALQRMSLPQAAERVGLINKWRADQMAEANAHLANNPAVHTYKEYPDDPRGLRWVELRQPEISLPDGYAMVPGDRGGFKVVDDDGLQVSWGMTEQEALAGTAHKDPARYIQPLKDALRYEGDAMGHCVGGYCDDVAAGRSRIFSLRDAKGAPHVTVEANPLDRGWLSGERLNQMEPGLFDTFLAQRFEDGGIDDMHKWLDVNRPELFNKMDIAQIKGKQNLAPKADYLPYVQDFVKSGDWGHVNELDNAGLFRLPDARYVPVDKVEDIATSPAALSLFGDPEIARKNLQPWNIKSFSPEDWEQTKHLFDGYARGGLAVKPDCGCTKCNALAVRRAG